MFWTDALIQRTLWGDPEVQASSTIRHLVAFAKEAFPKADCNMHRQVAFLTHKASQEFLSPMLRQRYGSLDAAKIPTLDWLNSVGSFETFARSTRHSVNGSAAGPAIEMRAVPGWYRAYCGTDRFQDMKARAEQWWRDYMGDLTCSENARHEYQVMHHRDYGSLGSADEFRCLVPKCNECHEMMRLRGPSVPKIMPNEVKKWL